MVCDAGECRAAQDVNDSERLKAVGRGKAPVMARLILWRGDGTLKIEIDGPLNVALEAEMALLTDGKVLLILPYQSCHDACVASAALDEHMIETIAGAGKIEIAVADLLGNVFHYPVSTAGYDEAVKALRAQSDQISEKMGVRPGDAPAQ